MLYKFKSRATADLILLEPHAHRLLQIIGKEPGASGIVTVEQIPAAVAALETAVAEETRRAAEVGKAADDDPEIQDAPDDIQRDTVTLRQRAAPFIEMLQRSAAAGHGVVWGA